MARIHSLLAVAARPRPGRLLGHRHRRRRAPARRPAPSRSSRTTRSCCPTASWTRSRRRPASTVEVVQPGDGGALVNQLVLTKDAPLGDLVFGIDNSFASRAVDEGVVAPTAPSRRTRSRAPLVPDRLRRRLHQRRPRLVRRRRASPEPVTLEDLTKPEYKDLLVVPNAVTSSPGLAFLLATVGAFGEDGWQDYWTALKANGLKVADGWSDAYYTDFSGGGGDGPRPIVLSYASSPPSTVPEGGTEPTHRRAARHLLPAGRVRGRARRVRRTPRARRSCSTSCCPTRSRPTSRCRCTCTP